MEPAYRDPIEIAARTRPITVTAFFEPESQELSHIGAKVVDLEADSTFLRGELSGLTGLIHNPNNFVISEGDYGRIAGKFYLEISYVSPYLAKELQKPQQGKLAKLDYSELARMFGIELDQEKRYRNIKENKKVDVSKVPDAYQWLFKHFNPFVRISGEGRVLRLHGSSEKFIRNEIELKAKVVNSTAPYVKSVDQQVREALSALKAYRGLYITQTPMIAESFLHFTDEPEFSSFEEAFERGNNKGNLIDAIKKWWAKHPKSSESYFPEPKHRLIIQETR